MSSQVDSLRDSQLRWANLQLPPLSLYIHIPWCVRKCPYCDFNSHQRDGSLPEEEYVDALLRDFMLDLPYVQGRAIRSIFFGGGTPSLFSGEALDRLLKQLRHLVRFHEDIEITLEANPGTAERGRFADYRQAGINRLSIGVQSFNAQHLKKLGRIHGSEDARRAIMFARRAGFDNINLDLMYGLEGQTSAQALDDLQQAIDFAPEHISWYQLTIEPNTEFYKRPPPLPEESTLMGIQDAGLALLADAGFKRYEVSAFARGDRRAQHNLNYWQFGDYLGIGAGAHGKISVPAQQWIVRMRKFRQPEKYLAALDTFTAETSAIDANDLPLEFMLNALRLIDGVEIPILEARTGLTFSAVEKQIESLERKGLMETTDGRIRTTPRGMQFLNSVLEEFVEGDSA